MTFELLADTDGSALVRISGELDLNTAPELDAAVAPIISGRPDRLVVDTGAMNFADSSAIALFVGWANRVGEIEIREPPMLLRRVIARMGLAERLRMTP